MNLRWVVSENPEPDVETVKRLAGEWPYKSPSRVRQELIDRSRPVLQMLVNDQWVVVPTVTIIRTGDPQ